MYAPIATLFVAVIRVANELYYVFLYSLWQIQDILRIHSSFLSYICKKTNFF